MADFSIKQDDTKPTITATLTNGAGTAIDLTGATVKFRMRETGSTALKVDAAATIVSAAAGTVSYQWVSGDTDTAGRYLAEWEITFAGGARQTVPSNRFNVISVESRLN